MFLLSKGIEGMCAWVHMERKQDQQRQLMIERLIAQNRVFCLAAERAMYLLKCAHFTLGTDFASGCFSNVTGSSSPAGVLKERLTAILPSGGW